MKNKILNLMVDKHCRKILTSIHTEPKTSMEIHDDTAIPVGSMYRVLKKLQDHNMVRSVETIKRLTMKPEDKYLSNVKMFKLEFLEGVWRVRLSFRVGNDDYSIEED